MSNIIYFLHAESISQKFYRPDNKNEFVIYADKGVYCPNQNPYQTNKGRISVTAICYDCDSFIEWISVYDALICKGHPKLRIGKDNLKEFLDPIEIV